MVVFLLVLVVVLALLGAVHWYVWRRLVRDVTVPGSLPRPLGTAAVIVLPVLSLAALVSGRADAPFRLQQAVAWPGFLWLAVLLYLVLALLAGEAVRPLLRAWLDRRAAATPAEPVPAAVTTPAEPVSAAVTAPAEPAAPEPAPAAVTAPAEPAAPDVSRRLFVSRVVGGSAAAVAVGTVGYGTYGVLRGPRVKRVTVPLAKIPRAAHGYRIAVVSDIHLGPILGRAHTQRIVDSINATQPDLIAVVGDLVDGTVENLGPAAEPLARLRARHGSFFVTGNHEYFSGADAWVDHVRELGLRPLRNARVEIPAGFDLAGVDDVAGRVRARAPTSRGPSATATGPAPRCSSRTSRSSSTTPYATAWTSSSPATPTAASCGPETTSPNWPTRPSPGSNGTATPSCTSRGARAPGDPRSEVGAPSDITIVELASKRA